MNGEESKYPFRQYVWALGHGTNKIPLGDRVDNRYQVVAPSIWLDTQLELPPKVPEPVPNFALPYLKAYSYQLNLPGIYGICHQDSGEAVLLLSNVPVSHRGQLMPAIGKAWSESSAFSQAYWLWQMITLWEPLKSFGAAASLLKKSNIRVEAWRVRLIGLSVNPADPPLSELGRAWEGYFLPGATPAVADLLKSVCQEMQAGEPDFMGIKAQINEQLLQAAAGAPIEFQIAGATSTGPQKSRNEDACYPSPIELKRTSTADLPLLPRLAIVCDGVGGHAGGEVASQMVVRSLQLQLRSLLTEAMEQEQAISPQVVIDQIEAAIRVANNLVAQQNDQQGRADRQRMGTTLVMALILPQRIETPAGPAEVNELYLTHIGDSRAYWITPEHCQLLTVDDDIAGREVSAGHSFYRAALQRPDASALTQAVGLRDFDQLRPHTQRFLFDSDGVLLLCSDGLSDHNQVETSWADYIGLIVQQIVPLEAAVDAWIELANQKNGHDNVTVVLVSVSLPKEIGEPDAAGGAVSTTDRAPTAMPHLPQLEGGRSPAGVSPQPFVEMTAASRALLYGETEDDDTPLTEEEMAAIETEPAAPRSAGRKLVTVFLALFVLGIVGAVGWLLWRTFEPLAPNQPLPPDEEQLQAPPDAPPNAPESE